MGFSVRTAAFSYYSTISDYFFLAQPLLRVMRTIAAEQLMNRWLDTLAEAISDVGYWQWWAENLPQHFQVEFGGTQLWNAPMAVGEPPSGQIALRFINPKSMSFLT